MGRSKLFEVGSLEVGSFEVQSVNRIRYIILGPSQLDGGATLEAQVESRAA